MSLVAIAATACSGRLSERTLLELDQQFDLPQGATHVRIQVVDGDVTVKASEDGALRVRGGCLLASDDEEQHQRLTAGVDGQFELDVSGGVATIRGPQMPKDVDPMLNRVAVRVEVFVPATLPVDVRAEQRGHLAVWDRQAEVRLENTFGDLSLTNVTGHATIRSDTGRVMVSAHRGSLDIDLKSGDQVLYLDRVAEPGLRLETGQGRIQCMLLKGTQVQLDALTDSGKVTNGLDIPTERYGRTGGRMLGGEGGPEVRMRTGKGNLSLGYRK